MAPPAYIQANTNGRLHAADEPALSPLDRGFLYGDAIYEVWRTYDGVIFAWEEHWRRLQRSARSLHFEIPWPADAMLDELRRTAAAFRERTGSAAELYLRLQISRGCGAIGLDTALAERPTYVMLVQPCPAFSAAVAQRGLRLSFALELRRNPADALNPAWKTGNYLNNILALREARSRGADEVLMLNLHGEITEAAVSNVAFVRDGEVVTPALESGILAGITRGLLLEKVGPAAGVRVSEARLRPQDLPSMEECFLLSSTKDLTPVGSVDDLSFPVGPDTVTARLKQAFQAFARNYAREHPALRLAEPPGSPRN